MSPLRGKRHGSVPCWVIGCRGWGGEATSVEIVEGVSVAMVLCPTHDEAVRRARGCLVVEPWPDPDIAAGERPEPGRFVVVR